MQSAVADRNSDLRVSRAHSADQGATEKAYRQLQAAIEALPHGFVLYDADDRLVICNRRYRELYQASAPAIVPGTRFEDILRYGAERGQYIEAIGAVEEWIAERLRAHRQGRSLEQRLGDGRHLAVTEQRMADGSTVGIRIDVTELRRAQEALEASEQRFRSIAEVTVDAIIVVDETGRIGFWSAGAARMFDWPREEALGASVEAIIPEQHREAHRLGMQRFLETRVPHLVGRTAEITALRRDGASFPAEVSMSSWQEGERTFFCAIMRDITERKRAEDQVRHLAFFDALTGLANRLLLMDRLRSAVAEAVRNERLVAVLCLDLDRFKEVNDTLGHAAGDQLLQIAAERLKAQTRMVDTVARLGGDEFAIVQAGISSLGDVQALCERLLEAFAQPFPIDDQPVWVGLSIGVALAPVDGENGEDLFRLADLALYRAKNDGRGTFRLFEPVMDAQLKERKAFERDLRQALARKEFVLDYQPQVDVRTGHIVGAEALLRWHHPEHGLLPPGLFIPIAEQSGLIAPIGAWVLEEACREAANWQEPIVVSVNLSPVQMRQRGFTDYVAHVLEVSGLPAQRLELEVTEGVLLQDDEQTTATLAGLKGLGVRTAIDDFGTGYSSLGYLNRFSFDRLKIDRSFIRDLYARSDSATIVRAIIGLGRGLAVDVTAEGVESPAQLAFLSVEGCSTAQGFHLGRPMSPEALATLLGKQAQADLAYAREPAGLAEPAVEFTRSTVTGSRTCKNAARLAQALGMTPGSLWGDADAVAADLSAACEG